MKGLAWLALVMCLAVTCQAQARAPFSISLAGTSQNTTLEIKGVIPRGADKQLEKALLEAPSPVRRVVLDSLGGSYLAGLAMGRHIRQMGLDTEVPAHATCQSACVFILAGGVKRRVDRQATIGIHSHGDEDWGSHFHLTPEGEGAYRLNNNGLAYVVGNSLLMAREGMMQLRQMGVGPEVAEMILSNPAHGGRICLVTHPCTSVWKLDNQTRLSRTEKRHTCELPPSLLMEDGLAARFQAGSFTGPLAGACSAPAGELPSAG